MAQEDYERFLAESEAEREPAIEPAPVDDGRRVERDHAERCPSKYKPSRDLNSVRCQFRIGHAANPDDPELSHYHDGAAGKWEW